MDMSKAAQNSQQHKSGRFEILGVNPWSFMFAYPPFGVEGLSSVLVAGVTQGFFPEDCIP
jgi:hypothetical protein